MTPVAHGLVHIALAVGLVSAVGPIPEIALLLQSAGAGGVVGSLIALRRRCRDPEADAWAITTAWSGLGLAVAALALLFAAVL